MQGQVPADARLLEAAKRRLRAQGVETDYLRIRALPLRQEVIDFALNHERVYVVENNFDGQMAQLIFMETRKDTSHIVSLASGDGLPMTPRYVQENILRARAHIDRQYAHDRRRLL